MKKVLLHWTQDTRKLVGMLEAAEEECWKKQHPQPFYFKVK